MHLILCKFTQSLIKNVLNFIKFYEKYIKFYVHVHKYTF